MTPEVYVNKEIMPLLLKVNCPLERVIKQDFRPVYYTKDFNGEGWQDCEAYYTPTQAQAMKWLREVHHLHITIFSSSQESWMYRITKPHQTLEEGYYGEDYISFEEACDDAIKQCLTKIL